MQVHYDEGVANHIGPEPCAGIRENVGEASAGLTRRVAGEPFLARLQELLRPAVVKVLIDPFLAAKFSNAVFAAKAFQTMRIFSSAE